MDEQEVRAEFIKLGFTEEDAKRLAYEAIAYKDTTAHISVEEATKMLSEAMKSFNIDNSNRNEINNIVNKLNNVN